MSRQLKQLLTALVGGLVGGLVLAVSLVIFIAVATPEAIAINPPLFFFIGMAPSTVVVISLILLSVYFGAATVWSFIKDFKAYLRETNHITFFYYAELFVFLTLPLGVALNTGLIANSILGGVGALISFLAGVALNVALIELWKQFAKNGGFARVYKALQKQLRGSNSMRQRPQV